MNMPGSGSKASGMPASLGMGEHRAEVRRPAGPWPLPRRLRQEPSRPERDALRVELRERCRWPGAEIDPEARRPGSGSIKVGSCLSRGLSR